ncbi:hypothetical protein KY290_028598 [Solanum tuberosum]|uniref:ATP synthase protein MI25 n=1 Tax=Solanum tuberosum TaxID=4113 RepID=A0ABQ7UID4_SOLTU|nr:hypothetical protein KY290_028598 [Solanum tuberosum]
MHISILLALADYHANTSRGSIRIVPHIRDSKKDDVEAASAARKQAPQMVDRAAWLKSLGNTFKVTLNGRIQAIQEESQQFSNPNEVVPPKSNEQQRLLRINLRICGTVVESLPMARCAPKCEKTVQALLYRNLNVKSTTLPNAISSRRIRLQDNIAIKMHV